MGEKEKADHPRRGKIRATYRLPCLCVFTASLDPATITRTFSFSANSQLLLLCIVSLLQPSAAVPFLLFPFSMLAY